MRERIVSYYEDRLPKLGAFFGDSGYYNFGYWRPDTGDAQTACDNLLERLLGMVPRLGGKALDVACGLGGTTKYLTRHFNSEDIVAINISAPQLEKARARVPACRLLYMDAVEMEFAGNSFDLVLCVEAAFHFDTRERFFREALRVLAPGGHLAVADILVREPEQLIPADNVVATPEEYGDLLRRVGFDYVEIEDATAQVAGGFATNLAAWIVARNAAGELSDDDFRGMARNVEGIRSGVAHYVLCAARKPL